MTGLRSALQFLTRLPVPAGEYRLEQGLVWFSMVGFVLGGILAVVDWALRALEVTPFVISVAIVVLLLILTGALHADGLMDTCDAVFAHATPERRLEIMRDPHIGAFGVVGLVCLVALKISAVDALSLPIRPLLLILAPGLGRWSIVMLATLFPYGRLEGLGAPLKAAATPRTLILASVLPAAACVAIGPVVGIACGVVAALVAWALGHWLMRLLPGLTGDCYGAVCEVVEALVWVVAAPVFARASA